MRTKGATRKGVSKGTKKRGPRTQVAVRSDPSTPLASPQHERFACEYLKDFNGGQAYTRTYPGVTPAAAATNAWRLLSNADVRTRVEHLTREALATDKVNAMKVVTGIARIASMDPRKAFDARGNLLAIPDLPDDVALAIAGIEVVEEFEGRGKQRRCVGYTKKLKFNDRLGALVHLGKHFRLFGDGDKPPEAPPERDVTPGQTERLRARLLKLRAPVTIEG